MKPKSHLRIAASGAQTHFRETPVSASHSRSKKNGQLRHHGDSYCVYLARTLLPAAVRPQFSVSKFETAESVSQKFRDRILSTQML